MFSHGTIIDKIFISGSILKLQWTLYDLKKKYSDILNWNRTLITHFETNVNQMVKNQIIQRK